MADAEGELQGWWWGPGQRSLITIRAYLLWERRSLSWTQVLGSPGVKTMIAIIEVGSPLSQRGWRWSGGRRRKSPLWRRCSLGEEEADKDSEEGNNWAYFWPRGFKTVKEKRVIFFFGFHHHFLVFPFHSHLKMYALSFPISAERNCFFTKVTQKRSFRSGHGAPICRFSHVRLEGYKIYRNGVQLALNMMKKC